AAAALAAARPAGPDRAAYRRSGSGGPAAARYRFPPSQRRRPDRLTRQHRLDGSMLTDRERLRRLAAMPHLVAFHRALTRLRSSVTVMNSGAHPDDEHNDMLAALRHEMGARIVVACSTRGEG